MGCDNFRRGTEKYYRPPIKKSGEEKIREYFNSETYRPIDDICYAYNSDEQFDKAIKSKLEEIAKEKHREQDEAKQLKDSLSKRV